MSQCPGFRAGLEVQSSQWVVHGIAASVLIGQGNVSSFHSVEKRFSELYESYILVIYNTAQQ